MSENVFHLTAGDLLPVIGGTLEDHDGEPIDLSTALSVSLHVRASGAATAFLNIASVAFSNAQAGAPSCGHVEHAWTLAAVPTAQGAYQARWRAHFSASRAQTVPNPGFIPFSVGPPEG